MSRTDAVFVVKTQSRAEREACLAIRRQVFTGEQNVPPDRDLDGLDDGAIHFLAVDGTVPVGTARVRFKENGNTAKIERVAVLKQARGAKIGEAIMQAIESDVEVRTAALFILEAQTYVIPFYQRLGYEASGGEFMDAGIPHRLMAKKNSNIVQTRGAPAVYKR